MSARHTTDKRLGERELLKGQVTEDQLRDEALQVPDSADNVEPPADEAIAALREDLAAEKVTRDERIHRSLTNPPPRPVPRHAAAPLDDEI